MKDSSALTAAELVLFNWVNDFFENFMNNPELIESTGKSMLEKTMIEPSLETVLGLLMGLCIGSVNMLAQSLGLNEYDTLEIMDKISRDIQIKMILLRESYEKTRFK